MATQLKKTDGKDGDGQGAQAAAKPGLKAKRNGGKIAKDGDSQNKQGGLTMVATAGDGVRYVDGLNQDEVEIRVTFRRREELGGTGVIRNPTPPPPPPITLSIKFH